ncbi:MAG: F0F1 ATP synthase subunit delta [Candidatus Korobacteraceae bacterium]
MRAGRKIQTLSQRLFRLCVVDSVLDEDRARAVAQKIVRQKRRGYLTLLKSFTRFVRLYAAAHLAMVESAIPLVGDFRGAVESQLRRRYGANLNTQFVVNSHLIAGMRVRVGSELYDGSLQHRLVALDASLSQ